MQKNFELIAKGKFVSVETNNCDPINETIYGDPISGSGTIEEVYILYAKIT